MAFDPATYRPTYRDAINIVVGLGIVYSLAFLLTRTGGVVCCLACSLLLLWLWF